MNEYRTHNCGELRKENVGESVRLAGWVQRIRDLGGMKFIDLRDEKGITQIVFGEDCNQIEDLTTESTVSVFGEVIERMSKNPKIQTGDIEVKISEIRLLGKCKNILPFEINAGNTNVKEDLRLEYRYLDLRNERQHNNILLRSKIIKTVREEMDAIRFYRNTNSYFGKFFSRRSKRLFSAK